ncbi:stalk domain-containing protein [Paenibacillus flagellatus]|uniref:Copper amine oxidase-like N-terminal domain-containing protein n=1 Tax=Paenibacillus flagellatus TaxID=2211139 RepID=A0A2V5KAP0_9BACL|nr:stalk domain-containing protein [Paenibacillus flagellatus]PYI55174.1 hypothetical protein DLM86_11655 [Paenibacillus flagellatus]
MNVASRMKLGLAVLLALSSPLAAATRAYAADPKSMSMPEAVDMTLKRSPALRDARNDVRQKQVELEQAYYSQKSEEEKASSLFAKPKNLSQQLQIKMKVPEARKQLTIAQETLRQKSVEVKADAEKSYLQVYQAMQAEQLALAKRDEAQKALDAVRQKLNYGLAKQPDREAAEQALEQASSAYKQAQLAAKGARLALGEKVGSALERPFAMTFEPVYADLSQRALPGYIDAALRTNVGLIQDVQTRRLADEKLNTTRNLYSSKFGAGRMKVFDRMFKSADIDMDLFTTQYEALLEQVRKDWQGYFWFIIFPIPKKLFQGEFDGLRYLDDLRNGLPIATMEQSKAALKEKESRSAVIAAVRQSYLDAKGAEESYAQALRMRDAAFEAIGKAESKRKLGLAPAEEVALAKEAYEQTGKALLSAQIAYMGAIGKLNVETGGALEKTYKRGLLPYKGIDDGLSPVKTAPEKPASGKWTVKPSVGELLSDFTATPDKKLKATDYALFDAKGKPIGKRTKVGKPLRALSIFFAQPDQLKIVLYRGTDVVGEAPLVGSATLGTFSLPAGGTPVAAPPEPPEGKPAVIVIGTTKARLDALTPELYNAAASTMKSSGQGIYYSPDGAVWFGMDRVADAEALDDPQGKAAVAPDELASLKVTMEVSAPGELKSLQTPEQLDKEIATLKTELEKLEADKQAATDGGQSDRIAGLTTQVEDAKARIAMLEALKKGDAKTALDKMALVNNAEAILESLAEWSENPDGGEEDPGGGEGDGSGGGDGATGGPAPSAEQLEAQAAERQAAVQAAIAAGDTAAALKAADGLLATMAQAAAAASGVPEAHAVLAESRAALGAERKRAEAAGDAAQADAIATTLAAVESSAKQLETELLFAEMDGVGALLEALAAAEPAPAPGGAAAAAQAAVAERLASEQAERLAAIVAKRKEAYSEEQLQSLAGVAADIAAETGGAATTLPPERLVSPTIPFRLDAPPIMLDGQAFIPLRAVSESFGAAVEWNEETMTATVSAEYGTIECTIGQPVAYLNGEPVELERAAELIAERTYVPLRFLAESLGLDVVWNDGAQTIALYE